jgi:hypothetical protein
MDLRSGNLDHIGEKAIGRMSSGALLVTGCRDWLADETAVPDSIATGATEASRRMSSSAGTINPGTPPSDPTRPESAGE